MVMHELFHAAYEEIAILIAVATIGGLFGFFANLRKCLDRQSARTLRLMKAMLLLSSEIDKQTNRNHKDANSTLEKEVDKILRDEKGHL